MAFKKNFIQLNYKDCFEDFFSSLSEALCAFLMLFSSEAVCSLFFLASSDSF